MKICFIAEGSYPHVTGGVASWMHSFIQSFPQHEFIIYAIGAHEKLHGHYKYELPENVVKVEEVFLDSYISGEAKWGKRYKISDNEKEALKELLDSNSANWDVLFSLFSSKRIDSVLNFLTSKDFFDVIQDICLDSYSQVPFTEMFWTLRSMVLSLFLTMSHPIPKADLYHSVSTGYAGVIGSMAKYLYQKPFFLTEHGVYTREREEEIIKATWIKGYMKDLWIQYFYNMSNCAYSFADEVITLFQKNKEIEIEIGCPSEKISVIPNSVDMQRFKYQAKEAKKGSPIKIGGIVRVVPIKDIKTMIHSFAIVKQTIPDAEFYIMGPFEDDEYFDECKVLIQNLGLTDVQFTGEVNIVEEIHSLDLLVLSSISEAQPLVILEGFACGIPVVTTDVGACKEMVKGINDPFGEAGVVVPIMDYVHMAEGIIHLAQNEDLRIKFGRNGYERVKVFYQRQKLVEDYRKLYTKYEG